MKNIKNGNVFVILVELYKVVCYGDLNFCFSFCCVLILMVYKSKKNLVSIYPIYIAISLTLCSANI